MIPLLFSTEDAISTIYTYTHTHTHKMLVLKSSNSFNFALSNSILK